jgi:acyl-CoA dehydrogenase
MNEELHIFRSAVRRFLAEEFAPQQARWELQLQPDAEAWKHAGAAGLLLTDVPEQYGGGGGTTAHEAVIAEELAQIGLHFGFSIQSIVAHYILDYATEEQKQNWLPRMARGELVGAIAMTEPGAGSDLQGIRTVARLNGSDYVLDGSKTFITNGRQAGIVVVAVRIHNGASGMRAISMVVVETQNTQGYRTGQPLHKIGQHSIDTCELFFDGVHIPAGNLLGGCEGRGFSQMMQELPYERLLVAVNAVATAERALALTTRYVKDRKAFGQTLFDLQNTRFQLAECKAATQVGRIFVDHCIENAIAGHLDSTEVAIAKYWLTEAEGRILDQCVQLHGGYGYMAEYPIARMWADSRVHRIYAGANEVMKEIIAASL